MVKLTTFSNKMIYNYRIDSSGGKYMFKKMMLFFIILSFSFLSGCSFLTFTLDLTTNSSTISTTQPTKINGTISIGDVEYSTFSYYHSATYDITNIDEYNSILLDTRDLIRRSNIQIETTLYTYEKLYPWSTTTVLQISGAARGSGVIFLEDNTFYYALTNYHVIDGEADSVVYKIATFEDQDSYDAELVTFDENLDLAVVKFLKEGRTDIHIIDYTTRLFSKFSPGELVFAVGNPLSVINNVTFGEFKAMESISNADFQIIYHTAAIHEGSSGGALVDVDGNLLGLNTWGLDTSDEYSFAVPNYIIYMFLINNGII